LSPHSYSSSPLQTLQTSAKLNLSFYEKSLQQCTWGKKLKLAFSPLWVWQKKGKGGGGEGGHVTSTNLIDFWGVGCRQTPPNNNNNNTPPPVPTCDVGGLASSNPFSLSLLLHTYDKISPNALLGTTIIVIKAQKAQANPPMCLCSDNTYLMALTCIQKTPF
jgi:hypothetical protein